MNIHSSAQTIFSFTHIEGITLGAGEEVDDVGEGATGMSEDRVGEVGSSASEREAVGVYETGFTVGSLARVGASDRKWGLGIKVDSDELMKVMRMAECS